ncbi:hypothetical protein C9374_003836 [Naegleria lovaniensis]|uniref:Vitellogenin domain-containing protein n=1 Tax=Naegleria lovaniensis TaxID=51637 RepID=A0AA88KSD1_NAELO|nr:uncharacterized protein C9374_003836 [Naegleria lovaniensis]KAG2394072.1 hypothetical protein C9374_003836 [Naegleria lovaniensis]
MSLDLLLKRSMAMMLLTWFLVVCCVSSQQQQYQHAVMDDMLNRHASLSRDQAPRSVIVDCPKGKSLIYRFKSTTLIGSKLSSLHGRRVGGQENQLVGLVMLTCGSEHVHERDLNVVMVSFPKVYFSQFQNVGNETIFSRRKYRRISSTTDMTKEMNKNPIIFIQRKSGHIQKLIFRKSEQRWIRSIKKGIIRMFTTETRKTSRSQTDGVGGKYVQQYERSIYTNKENKKSILFISQAFNQDDVSKLSYHKRNLKFSAVHLVRVDMQNSIIKNTGIKFKLSFDDARNHHAFREFEKLSLKAKKDRVPPQSGASPYMETVSVGSAILDQVIDNKASNGHRISTIFFRDAVKELEKNGRHIKLGAEFEFENTFMVLKKDRTSTRKLQQRHFNPREMFKLLRALKRDPSGSSDVSKLITSISRQVRFHPIRAATLLIHELFQCMNELEKVNNAQHAFEIKRYMEAVQGIISTVHNSKIQDSLVDISSQHPDLASNYVYTSIVIPKPTRKVYDFLNKLQKEGYDATLHKNDDIRENAYMAFADLASRLTDDHLKHHIVEDILTRIGNSNTENDLIKYFHALNNAGSAVDIGILEHFFLHPNIPVRVKVLLSDNIKKRVKDDPTLDKMIHNLINNNVELESVVKTAIINAQTEREKTLKVGASIQDFVKAYYQCNHEDIRSAIRHYLYTVGTRQAGDALARLMDLNNLSRHTSKHLYSQFSLSSDDMELLTLYDNEFLSDSIFFGNFFQRIGDAVRNIGNGIRNVVHHVGQGVSRVAHAVGSGIRNAANWVKDRVEGAVNAVRRVFDQIKSYFQSATWNNQQACVPANDNPTDQICLYNPTIVSFVQNQGDLSSIKASKHYEFEKLVGTNSVHMYMGLAVYAGTSFECSPKVDSTTGFEVVLYGMADSYVKFFSNTWNIIAASVELQKRYENPIKDKIYVKIFQTTFVDGTFIPDKVRQVIDACFSETKPILEKRLPKLVDHSFLVHVGPIPISFSFNVALNFGIVLRYGVCVGKLEASASIEPYISISVQADGGIGVPVAKASVYVRAGLSYRIIPRLAFEKCNLCAALTHRLDDCGYDAGLSASLMTWSKDFKLFSKQDTPYIKTLFEKCIGRGEYRPSQNDSPGSWTVGSNNSSSNNDGSTSETNPNTNNCITNDMAAASDGSQSFALNERVWNEHSPRIHNYRPMFGKNSWNIPFEKAPPKPSVETLRSPLLLSPSIRLKRSFLTRVLTFEILQKVPIKYLRRLPSKFFTLTRQAMNKIPYPILTLPSETIIEFLKRLPPRYYHRVNDLPKPSDYTVVWPMRVLKKRFPESVLKQVPTKYLRHLHEEILRIRKRVLQRIPIQVYTTGEKAIVKWVCENYRQLCLRMYKEMK